MWLLRWLLLCLLPLAAAGCGYRPTISILLHGDSALLDQIVGLRVVAKLDRGIEGTLTTQTAQPINGRLRLFQVTLPADPSGQLSLAVEGLREGDCRIASGLQSVPVEQALGAPVEVEMLRQADGCLVRVTRRGYGRGSIVDLDRELSGQKRISCSAETPQAPCEHAYAAGDRVQLSALPAPGSIFLGWTAPCSGRGPCEITVGDVTPQVAARFELARQCNADSLCWENPLPIGNDLLDVAVASNGDVWAVGAQGTVMRSEAGFWYVLRTGLINRLTAVHINRPDDVWIVGQCGVLLHYDGTELQRVPLPVGACEEQNFHGIWGTGPDDLWIVGGLGHVWHFTGGTLQTLDTGVTSSLASISGSSRDRFYVAGEQGVLLLWEGQSFRRVSVPDPAADLRRVWLDQARNEVWAVGGGSVLRGRADGSPLSTELSRPDLKLIGLWGSPSGTVWTAGSLGVVLRWRDGKWESIPSGLGVISLISGIVGRTDDDMWLVGAAGARLHWNGAYIAREQGGIQVLRYSTVHGTGPTNVWVGGLGGMARTQGDALVPTPGLQVAATSLRGLPNGQQLGSTLVSLISVDSAGNSSTLCAGTKQIQAMDALDRDHIWAVGDGGYILRRMSSGCVAVQLSPPINLHGVYSPAGDEIYAVGDAGELVHVRSDTAGSSYFLEHASLASEKLLAISASSPENAWIVGEKGRILHANLLTGRLRNLSGSLPTELQTVTMRGVWTTHQRDSVGQFLMRDAWIVGDGGVILVIRAPGSGTPDTLTYEMRRWNSGTDYNLYAVWGSSSQDVWMVGDFGAVLRYSPALAAGR